MTEIEQLKAENAMLRANIAARPDETPKAAELARIYPDAPPGLIYAIEELEREHAKLREVAGRLAVFAVAYRSHPKRNPDDQLDAALADHAALQR